MMIWLRFPRGRGGLVEFHFPPPSPFSGSGWADGWCLIRGEEVEAFRGDGAAWYDRGCGAERMARDVGCGMCLVRSGVNGSGG
jgi:hypothetical protein